MTWPFRVENLGKQHRSGGLSTGLRAGFNAPSVDEVDLSGYTGAVDDQIMIRASDDFDPSAMLRAGVVGVSPSIALRTGLTDAEGNQIESGEAVETAPNSGRWVYTATAAVSTGTTVRIAVTATDRPGGVAAAEEEKAI